MPTNVTVTAPLMTASADTKLYHFAGVQLSTQVYTAAGSGVVWPTNYSVTTKANDVGVNDHTTYDPTVANYQVQDVWDLGGPHLVLELKCAIYIGSTTDAHGTFEYSDDGTTWENAFTGASEISITTTGWINVDRTDIVTTRHRYWRLTVLNGTGFSTGDPGAG